MNWDVFFCHTKEEALAAYRDWHDVDEDDDPVWLDVRREKKFDNPNNGDPDDALRFNVGWVVHCHRCSEEVQRDDGESEVLASGAVVCTDCMTIDEWEIRDPERAAEMRSDEIT